MLFIGLDVGTTGTKAVVMDENGKMHGSGYQEYELTFSGTRVTQNAEDWWSAAVSAIRAATSSLVDPSLVRGIGISTQGATMLAMDAFGRPLGPAITWMDHRAEKQAESLGRVLGADTIYRTSGWRLSATCDAAKIAWLREEEPAIFAEAHCFVSTLEFMNFRMTGRAVIDPSNAAIRQLFNIRTGDWDDHILAAVGVSRRQLPAIQPTGDPVGRLTPAAASILGLSPEVMVFNGAHDQYCAAIGSGAVHVGDLLLATGTTWVVLGVTDRPLYTKSHIAPGIHPVKDRFGAMASLVSAGSALKWYKQLIGEDFRQLDEGAAGRMQSAKDLLFYPYLAGAGFPHNHSQTRGSILGLDMSHDKYDIARALMEGVAFETRLVLDEFAAQGMSVSRLIMTGGASRSRIWSEIVGYVTGCEVYRMQVPETCCVGAAMIAAVGLRLFARYEDCAAVMTDAEKLPLEDRDAADFYAEKNAHYRERLSMLEPMD